MVVLPFSLRGAAGRVQVTLEANEDPVRYGCDLLDPSLPPDAARGFPVCQAEVQVQATGYAAALGWVQLVRSSDDGDVFKPDPLALFREVDMPFAFFGVAPTLFDAPFRASRADLVWSAHSFLCAVPDGVMSRRVEAVVAFSWGFVVTRGRIEIAPAAPLGLEMWAEHVGVLSATYPTWSFPSG